LTRLRKELGDHDQFVDDPPAFAPGLPPPKS
jgi:hypothetical protein